MSNEEIKIPQMEELLENMKNPKIGKDIKVEFLGRVVTIVIAGLALVTALAWDETLKDIYKMFFHEIEGLSQKFGYAIFITIFSVVVSFIIGKLFIKKKQQLKEETKSGNE